MARYHYKIISVEAIDPDFPYACRFRHEDAALEKSMAARGLLQPLIVTTDAKPEILAGHKRFCAARALNLKKVEVLELQTALAAEEKFLLAILSNWNQAMPDIDKAAAVSKAVTFGFSKEMILNEIFPALGIPEEKGFYDESLEIMRLAKGLLDLIADGRLPFRGARGLRRLLKSDQEIFALRMAAHAAFTTNQLLKISEWLADLLKSKGQNLETFLQTPVFHKILASDADRKAKGDRFFAALRALHFPHLTEKREKFISLSSQFRDAQHEISLEAPPFFESEGVMLRARIKDAESLERLKSLIEQKRKVLNSLLDIVL